MTQSTAKIVWSPVARLVLVGVSLSCLYLFPYFPKINNPNENVRLYMTRAIVDDGSMALGRRDRVDGKWKDTGAVFEDWGYVNDKALVCDDPSDKPPNCAGILYSAKAPGTSFLGVPVYAALSTKGDSVDKTTAIYWLRLCCVAIPSVLFLWMFCGFLRRRGVDEGTAVVCTVGLGLGTMFFTYTQMFAGHQLASIGLFGALMCAAEAHARADRHPVPWIIGAGLLLATSIGMEYPTLFAALPVLAYLVSIIKTQWRQWFALVVGGALPSVAVMAFHTIAFGRPWRTPYSTLENPHFVQDIAPGFLGIRGPTWEAFWGSFFVPYNGLFFFSPWLVLAYGGGLWWLFGHFRKDMVQDDQKLIDRRVFLVSLMMLIAYTLFISSHSLWRGGWTLGPRYIVGITPPMVFCIAYWLSQTKGFVGKHVTTMALILVSILVTLSCSLVSQGFPFEFFNPFAEVTIPLLADGFVVRNVGNLVGLSGLSSIVPFVVVVAVSVFGAGWLFVANKPWYVRLSQTGTAVVVAAGIVMVLTVPSEPWSESKAHREQWLRGVWEPPEQSPMVQQLRRLTNTVTTERKATDHLDLGNLEARRGNSAVAINHYRQYLKLATTNAELPRGSNQEHTR